MRARASIPLAALAWLACSAFAAAQCPAWSDGFRAPGVGGSVNALGVFDPGTGPRLYAAGSANLQGTDGSTYRTILGWNGSDWSGLPGGPTVSISALLAHDDGSGRALYAGGLWAPASGSPGNMIARWNGSAWSAVGSGTNNGIAALAAFDEGSGAMLFAGGSFTAAGGVPAVGIARWNGSSWSALAGPNGQGVDGPTYLTPGVWALAVFDDGTGPALYAGGTFTSAGGVPAHNIARWDGNAWSALGSGTSDEVRALLVHDGGSGPALYATGAFTVAGGVAVHGVARWNGSTWSALAGGLGPSAATGLALAEFDHGSGPELYVGGDFQIIDGNVSDCVARWNGSSWSSAGTGIRGYVRVRALRVFDDGSGRKLYAGGDFAGAGSVHSEGVASWDGSVWSGVGAGMGVSSSVRAIAQHDDGTGPALYAGGSITWAGAIAVSGVARWNGSSWSALGSGVDGTVQALAWFDDGAGPRLYAGGLLTRAGSVLVRNVASWDGATWRDVGLGTDSAVWDFTTFDDGSGAALYAGGEFYEAGGSSRIGIARWNGASWSAVGPGLPGYVIALDVFDDGTGPALFAAGRFTASGVFGNQVARWNGSTWIPLGPTFDSSLYDLESFDDGSGPALYVGGSFHNVGPTPVRGVARWNGSAWTTLGAGIVGTPYTLASFDDGSGQGPALYAGGSFSDAGGTLVNDVARWDGTSWSALGSGLDGWGSYVAHLGVYDDGSGPSLFAGGGFELADGRPSSAIARWRGCALTGRLLCFGDGSGTACPCGNASAPGDRDGCVNSTGLGGRLRAAGSPSLSGDTLVLSGAQMTNGTALFIQGTSRVNGGAGVTFGDGLRCAGGSVVRLAIVSNSGGASHVPRAGDPPLSQMGHVTAPGARVYQVWFRDAQPYCTPSPFDLTNAVEIVWGV